MQVAVGRLQRHLRIGHAAQPRGDRRRIDVPHAGVADQRQVGGELRLVGGQERFEVGAADFLLALDQHGDARRDAAGGLLPGAQRLEEHHRLALVVHRAARDEALAARAVDQLRLERRAVPELQRIDRLHVVVAVEQDVRPVVAGRRRRDARRRRDGRRSAAPRRVKPSPASWSRTHSAARCAVLPMVRLRADRGNAQQVEQSAARGIERGIGVAQHGGDCVGGGHAASPGSWWHRAFAWVDRQQLVQSGELLEQPCRTQCARLLS